LAAMAGCLPGWAPGATRRPRCPPSASSLQAAGKLVLHAVGEKGCSRREALRGQLLKRVEEAVADAGELERLLVEIEAAGLAADDRDELLDGKQL
jgi:hypothetical protein